MSKRAVGIALGTGIVLVSAVLIVLWQGEKIWGGCNSGATGPCPQSRKEKAALAQAWAKECPRRPDDPEGYILRICQYLKAEGLSVHMTKSPESLTAKATSTEIIDGRRVIVVRMNCCGMGDTAYLDADSKEVLSYTLGAY